MHGNAHMHACTQPGCRLPLQWPSSRGPYDCANVL